MFFLHIREMDITCRSNAEKLVNFQNCWAISLLSFSKKSSKTTPKVVQAKKVAKHVQLRNPSLRCERVALVN